MSLIPAAQDALDQLLEGNARLRSGKPAVHSYTPEFLHDLSKQQFPICAIVACSDSRIAPELVFDQPLGKIFSSRVPANVASDSAKWMLELAVNDFHVPLVMVMGHTGCLAVGQLLDGDKGGAGGLHRLHVLDAVYRAKTKRPENLYHEAIKENVLQTVWHLTRDLRFLRSALLEHTTSIVGSIYHMDDGSVEILDTPNDVYGVF